MKALFPKHKFWNRLTWTLLFWTCSSLSFAQEGPPEIPLKKLFQPKGTHRAPFKKAKEIGLASVNLRFKTATREYNSDRYNGSVVTWAFLDGVDETLFQEITDIYYERLKQAFAAEGYSLSDQYRTTKAYGDLAEKAQNRSRLTDNKNWGIAEIFTANQEPYIEYPLMMTASGKIGNEAKMPVGTLLVTIDFAEIVQSITKSYPFALPHEMKTIKTSAKSTLVPMIRIEGLTSNKVFGGDGTYAKFVGDNWSYSNAILKETPIYTTIPFAQEIEKTTGFPTRMAKIKSPILNDLVALGTLGTASTKRGDAEFLFVVKANREAYKNAVLDALDKWNAYLMAYIEANN
jgi:hypothetical protein